MKINIQKALISLSFLVAAACLNLQYCSGDYSSCTSSSSCNSIFQAIGFNTCLNNSGCSGISSYKSTMAEFTCMSQCSNDPNDPNNDTYESFQQCIQDLVSQDQCSEDYTNCQQNSDCASIVNTASIQNCYNTNSYCTSLSSNDNDNTDQQVFNCYASCLKGVSGNNQNWYSLTQCITNLGICQSEFDNCYAEFGNCGTGLVEANRCAAQNCQISSIPTNGGSYNSCFSSCLNNQNSFVSNSQYQAVMNCVQNIPSGTLPGPSGGGGSGSGSTGSSTNIQTNFLLLIIFSLILVNFYQ